MTQPVLAEIRLFAGNFAPRSWALCQGQLLSIAQNQALFSLLGTIYGGDGRTTFALPDLRGRVAISPGTGPGLSPRSQGSRSGTENEMLNVNQIPSHNHVATNNMQFRVRAASGSANTNEPTDNVLADSGAANIYAGAGSADEKLGGVSSSGAITVVNNGSNQAHNNMMPYLSLNFIICTQGLFPSRN